MTQAKREAAIHAADAAAGYGVAGSRAATAVATTTAVFVDDGCGEDATGDDRREFYVTPGDDDGEPTGPTVTYASFEAAYAAAREMADATVVEVEVVTC